MKELLIGCDRPETGAHGEHKAIRKNPKFLERYRTLLRQTALEERIDQIFQEGNYEIEPVTQPDSTSDSPA